MAEETAKQVEAKVDKVADQVTKEVSESIDKLGQGDFSGVFGLFDHYLMPVVSALLILIVAYFVASFCARIVRSPISKRVDETLGRFFGKLVFYSIMIFTVLGVLGMFGVSVASFAAVIAAAGFAVGLAFQGTLSNFASGVLLLVFRPFKVGDVVTAGGLTGKIYEIDLFTTTFDTFDNRRIIAPNSSIAGNTIENVTYHPERRVDVNVGVDYSADITETRSTLSKAAESLKDRMIQGEGRGYQVYLLDLGDSSVNWVVRFWTKTADFFALKEDLTAAIKEELDRAGIGIPFPQLDVHIDPAGAAGELKAVGNE